MSEYTKNYFSQNDIWNTTLLPYQKHVLNDLLALIPGDVNSILDVGCGNGLITNTLSESIKVVGLDISSEALRHVYRDKVVGDITALPFSDSSFDLVMANDVIEHLSSADRNRGMRELARVAAKYLLITVPFLEDLNLGATKCGECGSYYHVNHHRKSFCLEELKNLFSFSDFKCNTQILSGDIWQSEPADIIFLKRMLLAELAEHNGPLCPYCGSGSIAAIKQEPVLVSLLNRMVTQECLENKELIDMSMLRTECISLYSINEKPSFKAEFIDNLCQPKLELLCNNIIEFSRVDIYRKNFLPLYSKLPYFVCQNITNEGASIFPDQKLLLGFFCNLLPEEGPVKLFLYGNASNKCTLEIYPYSDIQSYHDPVSVEVTGNFKISVPITKAAISRYGLLFEVRTNSGPVIISLASISNVQIDDAAIYDVKTTDGRFLRLPFPGNVYLSTSIYGDYFVEAEWMNNSSLLKQSNELSIYNNKHSKFGVALSKLCGYIINTINVHETEKELLLDKHNALQSAHNDLNTRFNDLQIAYDNLKSNYDSQLVDFENSRNYYNDQINVLNENYNILKNNYEALKDSFEVLQKDYNSTLEQRIKRFLYRKV